MMKKEPNSDGNHTPGHRISSISFNNPVQCEKNNKEQEYRFGWGKITPDCLQCFNKPIFLLFCLVMLLTVQDAIIFGILPASVTHIERRFHLRSSEVGGFVSVYNIGLMLTLFLICHYGSRGHKGRWIGVAALLTCLASVVCILPHFLDEDYQYGHEEIEMYCTSANANTTFTENCAQVTSKGNGIKVFFFAAHLLFGVAAAPMSNVAVAYLDENVSQRASSTYISIYLASNLMGPCIGYTAAAFLSKIYGHVTVDISTLPMKSHEDPRWYGAWWIGVLAFGLISGFFAIPMFAFSCELPGKAELRAKDVDQAHRGAIPLQISMAQVGWVAFQHQLKLLALNLTFVSLIIEQCATMFVVGGLATFATKYLETQFSLTTSGASIAAAVTGILPTLAGTAIGTVLIHCMGLKCRGNIMLAILGSVVATISWVFFFITCPTRPFAGVNSFRNASSGIINVDLVESCNEDCACPMSNYDPYCWITENISFFSKCHAGCNADMTNCSCTGDGHDMKKGLCESACQPQHYMPFLIGFAVIVFFASLKRNPVEQATLRCVPFQLRTFALAFGGIPKKLLGSIPATPTVGAIMSFNCLAWQEKCGQKEVCILYNNESLASQLQFFGTIGFGLACVALFLALMNYKIPTVEEKPQEMFNHSFVEGKSQINGGGVES